MAGKRRILLAEDDQGLQEAFARIAAAHDCDLVQTRFGAEVLTLAIDQQPDLVILDIGFPDADGRDVLAKLKADPRTAHIPVLVWSARVENESDRKIALDLGAEDHVEKIDSAALLRKVERILLRFE